MLARLLPDLDARVSGLPAPVTADPDTERHRLHTAVTDFLASAGRRQPLLLVLEDGHWADIPTLVLLRHLARARTPRPGCCGLITFPRHRGRYSSCLADALADLRRSDDVVRLHLDGLTEDDVGEFVRRAGGGEIDPAEPHPRALCDLTEGNAFLLCELWRALVETDAFAMQDGTLRLTAPLQEIATPQSVREVVSQRLSRLDPAEPGPARAGRRRRPRVRSTSCVQPRPSAERIDALEPAMRSGMIEERPFPALAYRFTHELVRRALYDRLSVLRRAELHLRIAEALENVDRPRQGRLLAGLAHHFAAAAPIGGAAGSGAYNLLAAKAASAALAYDETTARLRTALEMGIEDERLRAEILLDLGTALFRAGRSLDSLQSFRQAAEIAREPRGCGKLLARAAIGFETSCWRPGLTDEGARSSSRKPGRPRSGGLRLRVGLLASLARALEFEGDSDQAALARADAIAMARRIDYRPGLATVLVGIYWARATTSSRKHSRCLARHAIWPRRWATSRARRKQPSCGSPR